MRGLASPALSPNSVVGDANRWFGRLCGWNPTWIERGLAAVWTNPWCEHPGRVRCANLPVERQRALPARIEKV